MLARLTAWLAGDGAEDLVPSYFGFNVPLPLAACLILLAVSGVAVAIVYWRTLDGVTTPVRVSLVSLRTFFLVLALFLVLDPSIIAQRIKPGEQFVLLLFDDSQSMRLVGEDGLSRGERLLEAYEAALSPFEGYLGSRHQLARYRLGAAVEPVQNVQDLDFTQRESDLLGGISNALREMEGTSISAVVLFSDGVQQTANPPVALASLPTSTPFFTVGTDRTANWRDIELTTLSVSRTNFDKSPVVADVEVQAVGLDGREARVEVYLGPRLVKSRRIHISDPIHRQSIRLDFIPDRPGWLEYEARVALSEGSAPSEGEDAPQTGPDDRIKENNIRKFVIDNRDKTYRILYVSGRPNWENKFVHRALYEDDQLKLTRLISISNAEAKFVFRGNESSLSNPLFEGFDDEKDRPRYDETVYLRLGAGESELIGGYPVDAKELFEYSMVIWGDVERDFFTTTQFELTRDFVETRGGTLLLLGGPHAFTEGGFQGTIIENMLPVVLYPESVESERLRADEFFRVRPTVEGTIAGPWSFEADYRENRQTWDEMPPLYSLNGFPLVRAGATVMAEAKTVNRGEKEQPFFLMQRYGEGRCAVLATSDTWQWQMRLDKEDDRHERLWRQMARNLVHDVAEPAVLRAKKDVYTQGTPASFEFVVRDEVYDRREGLRADVTLTTPSGQELPLSVDESIQEAGLYSSRFTPEQTGLYTLTLSALNDKDEVAATLEEAFLVEPDLREFQKAQYNPEFLRDLAKHGEGGHYTLDQLPELAKQIPMPMHQDAEEVWLHLWHLPGFYIALVVAMALEWYLRRTRGRP